MADYRYVAVTNIPSEYHAADLRSHFSSLIENRSFFCFHFRHRPQKESSVSDGSENIEEPKQKPKSKRCCCVVKISLSKLQQMLKYNGNNWTNSGGEMSEVVCHLEPISLTSNHSRDVNAVDEASLTQMPELNPPTEMPNGNVGTPTLVFLDMIQQCLLPQTFVKKLQLQFPNMQGKRLYGNVNFKYSSSAGEDKNETNTPSTNSIQFHHVSMPVSFSKRTPKTSSVQSIPNDASSETFSQHSGLLNHDKDKKYSESETPVTNKYQHSASQEKLPSSGALDSALISKASESTFKQTIEGSSNPLTAREKKKRERADRKETQRLMREGIEERLIAIERRYHNDEDAEEWDRHEASEDDPSNQERNTERLYEQEEETPWEKGGPGVVFYTDAQFWQAREGDFDEKTTDDLDVDFSAYEEAGAGDKDIRDFLRIRQEQRFRNGYDNTDRFSIGIAKRLKPSNQQGRRFASGSSSTSASHHPSPVKIGKFEQFTKGVGRRVMERQGWSEGQGLGRSKVGIKSALKAEGQRPHDKQGLGYTEPAKLQYGRTAAAEQSKRRQGLEGPLISTVYDNPSVTDPKVPLLQRAEPTSLKHRQSHLDAFSGS